MDIFTSLNTKAYIKNNSTSDIYIWNKLCVNTLDPEGVITWANIICSSTDIWRVNSWKIFSFDLKWQLKWDTSSINNSNNFENAKVITKVETYPNWSFWNWILNVKVAKSSVSTFGWGASLLKWNNLSDVSNLSTEENKSKNKNLILTSIWDKALSSYVYKTDNKEIIKISIDEWNKDLKKLNTLQSNSNKILKNWLPDKSFNWLENIFIHNWDVNLDTFNSSWINKNTTYIIQNWNLTINTDIKINKNILFVVKWGNIIINSNVKQIDAILITIWENNVWWNINSDKDTNDQLNINWALYWNISWLLSNRTYIKSEWEYIKVGTNVNFSSKIFANPPPLLSKFLQDYLNVQKEAK